MTLDLPTLVGRPTAPPALEILHLSKTFSGVRVLNDVSFALAAGQVTALLGPNGCGKSTIIKVLAGFHRPDPGAEVILGSYRRLDLPINARTAHTLGLRFVHQDLGLVNELSTRDNFALANRFNGRSAWRPLARRGLRAEAERALRALDLTIDPDRPVGELSRTEQILVAIARALQSDAAAAAGNVVVLDEPTASLPSSSVDTVLAGVQKIRAAGGAVLYVTHRLDEVMRIADDVVMLRDGAVIAQEPVGDRNVAALAAAAIGTRERHEAVKPGSNRHIGEPALHIEGLQGRRIHNVNLTVHRGEIVGVTGLAGCGRSELARIICGAQRATAGSVKVRATELAGGSPSAALRAGIAFVPPNRPRQGCIPEMTVQENVSLSNLAPFFSGGLLRPARERSTVVELMEQFDVRPRDPGRLMINLSGGNQQKAVIAKFARLEPAVMVLDEPTQGVDVLGKADIASALQDLALRGCAVLIASSDFDEVSELCDRVMVLDRGTVVKIFGRGEITEQQIASIGAGEQLEEDKT